MLKEIFNKVAKIYNENGFRLFMIGGTSRDYLLGLEVKDFDFVTDATPEESLKFLENVDMTFAKFGSIHIKVNGQKLDITTLRKEGKYEDSRHPSQIIFVKDIKEDYKRRDFTINAIYIDENYEIIDPSNGMIDLNNKIIRFIGNPDDRINEDPLRIVRGYRFANKLGFNFEEKTLKSMQNLEYLVEKLNPEKIKEEQRKMKGN